VRGVKTACARCFTAHGVRRGRSCPRPRRLQKVPSHSRGKPGRDAKSVVPGFRPGDRRRRRRWPPRRDCSGFGFSFIVAGMAVGVVKKFYVNKTMQYERHGAALRRSAVAGYRWPRLSTMGRNDEASRTHERLAVGRFRPGEPGGRASGRRTAVGRQPRGKPGVLASGRRTAVGRLLPRGNPGKRAAGVRVRVDNDVARGVAVVRPKVNRPRPTS
jgi:hypothetical protein